MALVLMAFVDCSAVFQVGRITTVLKIDIDEVDGVDVLAAFSNVGNVGK